MNIEKFEQLVEASGMNVFSKYAPRFLVSLHVPTQFGTRIQCDTMVFESAEFAMLTPERAQSQIDACKKRLERAAKTKQGVLR